MQQPKGVSMGLLSSLGGIAGVAGVVTGQPWLSAAGSALGALGQQEFNADQAQANRDFQAQQSDTAMQRRVADLKAAGLSPMLAYSQGGAQAMSGATAAPAENVGLSSTSSGYVAKAREQELINMQQDLRNKKEEEALIRSQRWNYDVSAAKTIIDGNRTRELLPFEKGLLASQTVQQGASAEQLKALMQLLSQQYRTGEPGAKVADSPLGITGAVADRVLGTLSGAVGLGNALNPKQPFGININVPKGR